MTTQSALIRHASQPSFSLTDEYVVLWLLGNGVKRVFKGICVAALVAITPNVAVAASISIPELEALVADGELGKIAVVMVDQHGTEVYARRFDGKASARLTDIRSAGKSLTALAVGIAIDEGKLAVDTKVWPLLGSDVADPRNSITVRDLLTMSSALDCNDWNRDSPGQEEKMYRRRVWREFAMKLPLTADYKRDETRLGRFSYCTAGVFLLGQAVQEAVGMRFDDYVADRIFAPLGITDVRWRTSRSGEVQSGGQIHMRADDLLKIGRMVLDNGRYGDRQIVSEAWIKEMLQPHRTLGEYTHYGYLWWFDLVKSPRGYEPSWMMSGNGGNVVSIYRDYDAVIVVQARNYNKDNAKLNSFRAMWEVLAALPIPVPIPEA